MAVFNPQGTSMGFYYDEVNGFGRYRGFALSSQGVATPIDYPDARSTQPVFISPEGTVIGQYRNTGQGWRGFVLYKGQYATLDSNYPGAVATLLGAISPSGEIVGGSCLDDITCGSGRTKSFVISKKGVFTHFDPPGTDPALGSGASVIAPSGTIFGYYWGTDGKMHGYILEHGTYTTIDYPGALGTFIGGANAHGDFVGSYWFEDGIQHSYLFSHGVFTSFDPPGAAYILSGATGINNAGIIVGIYATEDGNEHGYIRTPR
jgi:hypothetical protein